ncbi:MULTISPECIES: nucleotide synthetase [unclassified Novosphingobium]|uniref:nucleotide synthetase n=1 Tax=unclassified Novosphingobium TaxID=2644732 RepID=UPI0025FE9547|nr:MULTISPECIES: nucleotide synthetase [unclassified Novosphingobium]HQV03766.1 hypothetical protein [Novosphingobium sp.]
MSSVNGSVTSQPNYPPSGSELQGSGIARGEIEISVSLSGGVLNFGMRDIVGNFIHYYQGERYVAVTQRSIIKIRLKSGTKWQFDKAAGIVGLKKQDSARFYHLKYDHNSDPLMEIELHVTPTGVPQCNAGEDERHPFTFYVLAKQRLGDAYPLAIDPDIKNPPPVGGRKCRKGARVPIVHTSK